MFRFQHETRADLAFTNQCRQTASAIDRLFAVLKDGPFRVGPKLTLLRTATGLSRNMLIDAGKALGVKKRKRGAGADAYSEWELPKSPV